MPTSSGQHPWVDALRVYLRLPVLAMLFLGFSAGLPFLLVFSTLTTWLRTSGVEVAAIGFRPRNIHEIQHIEIFLLCLFSANNHVGVIVIVTWKNVTVRVHAIFENNKHHTLVARTISPDSIQSRTLRAIC